MKCLVTGGEGFIGVNLIKKLLENKFSVTSLDKTPNLKERIKGVNYITIDIREDLKKVTEQFELVFHLAAEVGSGLSMSDPLDFVSTNSSGTCNLLEHLRKQKVLPKIIIASSATVYGEATYESPDHGICYPDFRPVKQLDHGEWELKCPISGKEMKAVGILENRPLNPASIYGESKLSQERICILLGRSWGFDTCALRLFGVFGPGQSLGNPYTGVLAFFSTLVLAGIDIEHYEDGGQLKGYTYIDDVIEAFIKAALSKKSNGMVFNIGMKEPVSILDICKLITKKLNPNVNFYTKGNFRVSDTRHSWPDVEKVKNILGWEAKVSFEDGLDKLLDWMKTLSKEEIDLSLKKFRKAQRHALEMGLPL